jgi:hypothetical protein
MGCRNKLFFPSPLPGYDLVSGIYITHRHMCVLCRRMHQGHQMIKIFWYDYGLKLLGTQRRRLLVTLMLQVREIPGSHLHPKPTLLPEVFRGSFHLPRQVIPQYLKTAYDRFFPHPFQRIVPAFDITQSELLVASVNKPRIFFLR